MVTLIDIVTMVSNQIQQEELSRRWLSQHPEAKRLLQQDAPADEEFKTKIRHVIIWPSLAGFVDAPVELSSCWLTVPLGPLLRKNLSDPPPPTKQSPNTSRRWYPWVLYNWLLTSLIIVPLVLVNAVVLAPWLVLLHGSLALESPEWTGWQSTVKQLSGRLILWLLLASSALSLISLPLCFPWFMNYGYNVFRIWSALIQLIVALTFLVPAIIVVRNERVGRAFRTGVLMVKRNLPQVMGLYAGYVSAGGVLSALWWLGSHLPGPVFPQQRLGTTTTAGLSPLKLAWFVLIHVICWKSVSLWLQANFMAIVLSHSKSPSDTCKVAPEAIVGS